MRSWLFFAALVMIATGVMHCFPYSLKYKNSLALKQIEDNMKISIEMQQGTKSFQRIYAPHIS